MAELVKSGFLCCGAAVAIWCAPIRCSELPPLPRAIAGQFVGALDDLLVVAGGSWWTAPPAEGGRKLWTDEIHVLSRGDGEWLDAGRLSRAAAYGGTVTLPGTVVLVGGQNGNGVTGAVQALRRRGGKLDIEVWPSLPEPSTNLSVAYAAGRIYAFGGQRIAAATSARNTLWSLSLGVAGKPGRWTEEPPLPAGVRILAGAAGCGDTLYILSGAALAPAESGTARRYLKDAWSYRPGSGWTRLPDLPSAAVGAPVVSGPEGAPVLLGGDDGRLAGVTFAPGEVHPGFSHSVIGLDRAGRWVDRGGLPLGLVTSGAVRWQNTVVIAGGEDRPGRRSGAVLQIQIGKEGD